MNILKCGGLAYRTEKSPTIVLNNSNIILIRLHFLLGAFKYSSGLSYHTQQLNSFTRGAFVTT